MKRIFFNLSIFKKMFFGIMGIVFLIILPSTFFSYMYSKNIYEKEVISNAAKLAENLNGSFNDYIKQIDKIVLSIYTNDELIDALERRVDYTGMDVYKTNLAMKRFYEQLLILLKDFRGFYIYISEQKQANFQIEGTMKPEYSPVKDSWYKKALEGKGKVIVIPPHKPYQLEYAGEVISFACSINNYRFYNLNPMGVILVDISPVFIDEIIKRAGFSKHTGIFLIDDTGALLYSNGTVVISESIKSAIEKKLLSGINDADKIVAFERDYMLTLSRSGVIGWNILIATPYNEIIKGSKSILLFNAFIAFMAILFSSLISYAYSKLLFRPISTLQKGIKHLKEGNFKFQLESHSSDEMGQLIDSFNSMIRTINALIVNQYEEKIARKEAELKFLQSQINPHFLYNTLQTISSMAVLKKAPEINSIAKNLARILRYAVSETSSFVTLQEELSNLVSYLDIQKLRFKELLNYNINASEKLKDCKILKFILQPIVENSIIHGMEGKGEPCFISINAAMEDECINIHIEDNGIGISQDKVKNLLENINSDNMSNNPTDERYNTNIGLRNINKRIKLAYGEDYGITVDSEKWKWTRVSLKIPKKE